MQENSPHRALELRAAARTNLFLAATMHSANIGHPVKIRDLSATGARIETLLATEVGDAVTLVRGLLSVDARVSWQAERFCGLSFNSPVSIRTWMTDPVILERRRKYPRVMVGDDPPDAAHADCDAGRSGRVAQDLRRVCRSLETLGEALADDPGVVFKYGTQVYNLRLAARTLATLADIVQAGALEAAGQDQRRS